MAGSPEAERYGATLPRIGQRELAEQERVLVIRRLRRVALEVGLAGVGIASAVVLGSLTVPAVGLTTLASFGGAVGFQVAIVSVIGVVACLVGARSRWRIPTALGVVYLLAVTALPQLAPATDGPPSWLRWGIAFGLVLVGNGYLALALWKRIRILRRARLVRRDLKRAVVDQFEGTLDDKNLDETLRTLRTQGVLDPSRGLHRLEILPRSGWIIRAQGRVLPRPTLAHIADVACAQPHALRVSLPRGLTPRCEQGLLVRRRSLTPAEREEIAAHIARLRRRYWPTVVVTAAVVVVIALQLSQDFAWRSLLAGPAIGWYILAALTYVAYGRRVFAARRLESDRKLRWVVTVDETKAQGEHTPKLEVLPISQLAWTENATPAGWRFSRL